VEAALAAEGPTTASASFSALATDLTVTSETEALKE